MVKSLVCMMGVACRAHVWLALCLLSVAFAPGVKQLLFGPQEGEQVEPHAKAPRVHGGVRQQLAATKTAKPIERSDLPLYDDLRRDWAKGDLTSAQVQRYALSAELQGAVGVEDLAKVGSYGKHTQNLFRGLVNVLGFPKGSPHIDWVNIPTRHGPRTAHPVLMPHRFFMHYLNECPENFESHISGAIGACFEFWSSLASTKFVMDHPHLADKHRAVPLGFHCDGGQFSKQDRLYCLSWNSLMAKGSTIQKRFLFTVFRKSEAVANTLDTLLSIFSWSMNALARGETPHVDWTGKNIFGGGQRFGNGWRGILSQCRGDWQYYTEAFYVPAWNCLESMCWICRASSYGDLSYTNCCRNAPWRDTLWTHESYMEHRRASGLPIPIIVNEVEGFRHELIFIDVLHCLDLGLTAHIVANIMWILAILRNVFGGSTYKERVERMSENLKKWYNHTKCPNRIQGKLTPEKIRTSKYWPKLKFKGAAVRHLSQYALYLMLQYGQPEDIQILAVIQLMCRFYEILSSESMFFSQETRESYSTAPIKLKMTNY